MLLTILKQAECLGILRAIDYHFARCIDPQGPVSLAAALVSYESHLGHVCLPLQLLSKPEKWFEGRCVPLANQLWQQLQRPTLETWEKWLRACDAVGDGKTATPLVLDNKHLYLYRFWQDECCLASFFRHTQLTEAIALKPLQRVLSQLFSESSPSGKIDWQKVAVAVALTRKTSIIVGGPGSGKTTTIARILSAYLLLSLLGSNNAAVPPLPCLRMQLAAATGKAAARLLAALTEAKQNLPLDETLQALLPTEAVTLHRLLGAHSNRPDWRYHRDNLLSLDLLVIDEVSLVSLPMMARLIEALPSHARLILLGDSDQLPAVEAGAVLSDLVQTAISGYSRQRIAELNQITGYSLPATLIQESGLGDAVCHLMNRYRFSADSVLDQLARSIQQGDSSAVWEILQGNFSTVTWYELTTSVEGIIEQACVQGYRRYLERAKQRESPQQILVNFSEFQVLCALKEGPFGVSGLNRRIEQALVQVGLINRLSDNPWYCGRPILITANHDALGLTNGDVGITLFNPQGRLVVYFNTVKGSVVAIDPRQLPSHETTYALTIHKAQGSECSQVLLVLPQEISPVLTRELLYTAVTRAKEQLTMYADQVVLQAMLKVRCKRYSQLSQRLSGNAFE